MVDLRFPGISSTQSWFKVFGKAGTWLYTGEVSRPSDHVVYLPAGRAYIVVAAKSDNPAWGERYTLEATLKAAKVESEPNGSKALADKIKLGDLIYGQAARVKHFVIQGESDYYRVTIPKTGKVSVTLGLTTTRSSEAGYQVEVTDAKGRRTSYTVPGDAPGKTDTHLLKLTKGTAYISVKGLRAQESLGRWYSLRIQGVISPERPKIAGKAIVGKTLSTKRGSWSPSGISFRYQWYRNGEKISGATKASYRLVKADKGKKITVAVTGKKSGYITASETSKATAKIKSR